MTVLRKNLYLLSVLFTAASSLLAADGGPPPATQPVSDLKPVQWSGSGEPQAAQDKWLELAAADSPASQAATKSGSQAQEEAAAPPTKGPPLPFHTIDGTGGILITPTAYLVNPGPPGTTFGLPAASATYVNAGQKNIESAVVTETLFQRVELGFGASRFGLGTLPHAVEKATGVDIGRDDVYLYNFNIRGLLLEESKYLPAITAGVDFKVNDGIDEIDNKLAGALRHIGFDRDWGVDYTLTASKTFANVFGRPLIVSAGLRLSDAAQVGYLGFGDEYHPSFEGNATYLITDWLGVAYEFRQKVNPYDKIGGLVGGENNWQTIGLGFVLSPHATITAGYGYFGTLLNSVEDGGWALAFKYEF